MVWVYYSSQVFFLGAELTCAYAEHRAGAREAFATKGPDVP
jgi:uncharacterized BrkB/YihY/UPF0761 family membrane protein